MFIKKLFNRGKKQKRQGKTSSSTTGGVESLNHIGASTSCAHPVSCGNELVYCSVYQREAGTVKGRRIKLMIDDGANFDPVGEVKLVHVHSSGEYLFIVNREGMLFGIDLAKPNSVLEQIIIDSNDQLQVEQIASYTEAVLFTVKNGETGEYFIYGQVSSSL